jgi:hypothetical protein
LKDLYPQKETAESCGKALDNYQKHEKKFIESKKLFDQQNSRNTNENKNHETRAEFLQN